MFRPNKFQGELTALRNPQNFLHIPLRQLFFSRTAIFLCTLPRSCFLEHTILKLFKSKVNLHYPHTLDFYLLPFILHTSFRNPLHRVAFEPCIGWILVYRKRNIFFLSKRRDNKICHWTQTCSSYDRIMMKAWSLCLIPEVKQCRIRPILLKWSLRDSRFICANWNPIPDGVMPSKQLQSHAPKHTRGWGWWNMCTFMRFCVKSLNSWRSRDSLRSASTHPIKPQFHDPASRPA